MSERDWDHRLLQHWWIRLPLTARHLSHNLAATLSDGFYLAAWPRIGAAAPPLSLFAGFLVGWLHLGFSDVFTESMSIMVLAGTLGILSAHLGTLFLVGFILGDFLLAHTGWFHDGSLWQHLLQIRLPLVIEYSLLALLTTGIPVWTKSLLLRLPQPRVSNRRIGFSLVLLGHAILTYGLVYYWTHLVPVLIGPVFTWRGIEVPIVALAPLQQHARLLILVAVLASLVRMTLQGATVFNPRYSARLDDWQNRLVATGPVRSLTERVPVGAKVAGRTLWMVVLLAGVLHSWVEGLLFGLLFFFVLAARAGLLFFPLGRWPALVQKVPLVLRVGAAIALLYSATLSLLEWSLPFVVMTGLAVLLFFLLVPDVPQVQLLEQGESGAQRR